MKTIIIDYDLYQLELLKAKQEGFEVVHNLKERLNRLTQLVYKSNFEDWDKTKIEIFDVVSQLNKIDFNNIKEQK
jgi:hypothetical protein